MSLVNTPRSRKYSVTRNAGAVTWVVAAWYVTSACSVSRMSPTLWLTPLLLSTVMV